LQRFFRNLPPGTGCAYVVIMHLDPNRPSLLADVIGRATTLPVAQAEDGMPVVPDHIFIIPPGTYLTIRDGRLVVTPMLRRPPRPDAVDRFMVSLAADQRERAVGIVLTGADSDGAIGLKAVKSEGGITFAQTPESAAHPGMPLSALGTGIVDALLPIEQIPQALVDFVAHAGLPTAAGAPPPVDEPPTLSAILAQVRLRTGLDFRGYKMPMLARRVRRRMGLCGVSSLDDYLARVTASTAEARSLADDFLIGVTEFFREPDAWRELAELALPALLQQKGTGEAFRIWAPACSTGEEAYSLGMLLLEQPWFDERQLRLQIFATDVDRRALDVARHGHYPETAAHAVSADRLRRFFVRNGGGYQVGKRLRESVVFAPQNLTADPPFSRIDLLSCRNLLIYLEAELQARVLQLFHFALEPGGVLFLGKSESANSQPQLFEPISHRHRIYRRLGVARSAPPQLPIDGGVQHRAAQRWPAVNRRAAGDHAGLVRDTLLALHAPAAVLINRHHRALYFHGPVRSFVEQPEGTPTDELLPMVREGLRPQLRAAVFRALNENARVESVGTMSMPGGEERNVRIAVTPIASTGDEPLLLVTFQVVDRPPLAPRHEATAGGDAGEAGEAGDPGDAASALQALEAELSSSRRELRAAIEELEAANEELKVANEEAMAMNEELQSTNEELETSKEELQSVNEELTTVNQQLQEKVIELETTNDDLGNLLASTHIPTLFLDRQLRIKRFTPAATRLFRLIATDVGRPLTDIAGDCDKASLLDDARQVLERLAEIGRQIETPDGHHYLQRILPYRTQEDRIEGVVVTYSDVTEVRQAAERMRRYATVMRDSNDAIVVHDLAGIVQAWNRGAEQMYGHAEPDAIGMSIDAILPPDRRAAHDELIRRVLAGERAVGVEGRRVTRAGDPLVVSATLSRIDDDAGRPVAIALTDRDMTERVRAEAALRDSEARFRALADDAPVLIWMADADGRLEFANREFARQTGQSPDALLGRPWSEMVLPEDLAALPAGGVPSARRFSVALRMRHGRAGGHRWMTMVLIPRHDAQGRTLGHVGCAVDIDSQKTAENALRDADRRKDEFLAMLGHELRNPLAPIRNAAEVLRLSGSNDPRIAWASDTLVRQVAHVTRLVDDLLDISRITRGAMNLRFEPVDLVAAVARAIDALRALIQQKRHRLEIRLPDAPVWVEGDPIRLTQVFENLLTNAAKYTDDGGELAVWLETGDGNATVHVRDNGIGIAPAMRAQVFDLFVQDERSLDRSQGGLGIGLSLVRHLVELHHGQVDAFSEGLGRGSDFVVRLPVLKTGSRPREERPAAEPAGGGGRVLLVDDDRDAAESLSLVLQLQGFEVATAFDLRSALREAARFSPQAVVLDLGMPGADGYEVAKRMRALPQAADAVYVALTGFGRSDDLARTRDAGFAHHLVKPADPTALREIIAQAIRTGGAEPRRS
jgi:two-component system, chemotaxis family, CheB/CheR fusion protein